MLLLFIENRINLPSIQLHTYILVSFKRVLRSLYIATCRSFLQKEVLESAKMKCRVSSLDDNNK